jgi:hypothetical protein
LQQSLDPALELSPLETICFSPIPLAWKTVSRSGPDTER